MNQHPPPSMNASHPLCQGLRGWWLAHPVTAGGALFHDLTPQANHAVITGSSPGAMWNQASPRIGGHGSLRGNNSAAYAIASAPLANGAVPIALSAWLYRSASATDVHVGISTSVSRRFGISWPTDNNLYLTAANRFPMFAFNFTGWHHFTSLLTSTGQFGWVNGRPQTLTGTQHTGAVTTNNDPMWFGREVSGGYGAGAWDDVQLRIGVTITDVMAYQIYVESLQGFPGMLSSVRRSYRGAAAATGNRRRRVIMGSVV